MRTCPACDKPIPSNMAFCRQHWYALPKVMRDRIWASWNVVQQAMGMSATAAKVQIERHHELLQEAAAMIGGAHV